MRVIKVLFLLVFFFFCVLFFVQNTPILETSLQLKLEAFGYQIQSPGVPFYIVLLMSFVAGGLFATLYFLAEKVRQSAGMRSLQNKVNALEKQMAQHKKSTVATPPSYVVAAPTASVMPAAADSSSPAKKAEA